jgi:hypothetical protein
MLDKFGFSGWYTEVGGKMMRYMLVYFDVYLWPALIFIKLLVARFFEVNFRCMFSTPFHRDSNFLIINCSLAYLKYIIRNYRGELLDHI